MNDVQVTFVRTITRPKLFFVSTHFHTQGIVFRYEKVNDSASGDTPVSAEPADSISVHVAPLIHFFKIF